MPKTYKLQRVCAASQVTVKHAEMFWSRVDKSSGADECWPWTMGRVKRGYGMAYFGCRDQQYFSSLAHRAAWILSHPDEQLTSADVICHRCDNPPCCNPTHLFRGTILDNAEDMVAKGRSSRGSKRWNSKLTDATVLEIRRKHAAGHTRVELAREYGVNRHHISAIVTGARWKHLPDQAISAPWRSDPNRTISSERTITQAKVLAIRRLVASGRSKLSVAKEFGVSHATIRHIIAGKTWAWVKEAS